MSENKTGRVVNKLTTFQSIKLHEYLKGLGDSQLTNTNNETLASLSTAALGFSIKSSNIEGMLRDVFQLDKKTRTKSRTLGELEALIINLYDKLGQELPQ